jgi:hypothetical protein
MEDSWQTRLRTSVGDSRLWKLRRRVILSTARDFVEVGRSLSDPVEADEETQQGLNAFALLMQIAGELAFAAGRMLSDKEHYAGAVLLVDLIVHCWRTWDQLRQWSNTAPTALAIVLSIGRQISPRLNQWGARDPMYALMVERYPEKKVDLKP